MGFRRLFLRRKERLGEVEKRAGKWRKTGSFQEVQIDPLKYAHPRREREALTLIKKATGG